MCGRYREGKGAGRRKTRKKGLRKKEFLSKQEQGIIFVKKRHDRKAKNKNKNTFQLHAFQYRTVRLGKSFKSLYTQTRNICFFLRIEKRNRAVNCCRHPHVVKNDPEGFYGGRGHRRIGPAFRFSLRRSLRAQKARRGGGRG